MAFIRRRTRLRAAVMKFVILASVEQGDWLMAFTWNDKKAARNLVEHGVSFDEAKTVFDDPLYVDFYDPDHSYDEHRFIIMGQSQQGRLLLILYTERGDTIRLISARELTPAERRKYEEG